MPTNEELFARARRVMPGGVSSPVRAFGAVGGTPRFAAKAKGEMILAADRGNLPQLLAASYSCGKGKRLNRQCGRCIPCLIRRASFAKAEVEDASDYYWQNLAQTAGSDDVLAARTAVARLDRFASSRDLEKWAAMSGPLPKEAAEREAVVAAVGRGVGELKQLFSTL